MNGRFPTTLVPFVKLFIKDIIKLDFTCRKKTCEDKAFFYSSKQTSVAG